jgi:hypothetical protein
MSTQPMPMVQVFAPDGTLGDIPYDRLHDALDKGAKIAAKVKAPDGTVGFVPGDRVPDAIKAGGQRVPLDMNEADGGKPGFWSQAYDKLKSQIPQSGGDLAKALGGSGLYEAAKAVPQGPAAVAAQLPGGPAALEYLRSRDAGAGVGRSALNAAGASVGVDPAQQEAMARAGNTAGVAADAAVPIAETLLGYGAHLAAPAVGDRLSSLASNYKPQLASTAEALQHPAAIPGKVATKLVDLIPDTPAAAAEKARLAQEAEGEQVVQAMKIQDPYLRREAVAKARAEAAAAKDALTPKAAPAQPVASGTNYGQYLAQQDAEAAAKAQAAKEAAKADAAARKPVPLTQSPYYAQNQAAAAAEEAARQPVPLSQSPYYTQNQAAAAAEEAARKPVPLNQSPYYTQNQAAAAEAARPAQPLSPVYGPPTPSPEQVANVPLSDLATPRTPAPTSEGRPATWTNDKVRELAAWGDPDAIDQARARGFGRIPLNYSTVDVAPRSVTQFSPQGVPLRDLVGNQTLNPVGGGGARPIVSPEAQFESSFGPEHQEVGDLAEWETGNREGVKVGSSANALDSAAKSMFGAKDFSSLNTAQKAHILRIAQTQVAVP